MTSARVDTPGLAGQGKLIAGLTLLGLLAGCAGMNQSSVGSGPSPLVVRTSATASEGRVTA
ncbi:MAG: hypothetical protein CL536_03620, partial [Alcaligenaceae bacterium]|nr:hypothetical protein [Alcaligenaceae bacterium]